MKNLVVAAQHFGAANAVAPVIYEAQQRGIEVTPIASKQAEIVFGEWGFDYKTMSQFGDYPDDPSKLPLQAMKTVLGSYPDAVLVGSSTERDYIGIEKLLNEINY